MRRTNVLSFVDTPTRINSCGHSFASLLIENCIIHLSEFDQFDEVDQAMYRECHLRQVDLDPAGMSMTRRAAEV